MLSIGDKFFILDEAKKIIQSFHCITKLHNLENNEESKALHLAKQQGRPKKTLIFQCDGVGKNTSVMVFLLITIVVAVAMQQYRIMKGGMQVFILGLGGILVSIFGLGGIPVIIP